MDMPVTTTFNIEGYRIAEYKGVVSGMALRVPFRSDGFVADLKKNFTDRTPELMDTCEQARKQAYGLLIHRAQELGANAIVGLHYDTSVVSRELTRTEVLCYGTAVVIERLV